MSSAKYPLSTSKHHRSRALLTVFALAVAIVAMLVFINRSEHFQVRPVSGAANAMSQAADLPDGATRGR